MKSRFLSLSVLVALVFGSLLLSCSKERKLLDAIPSDVDQISVMRLKTALEDAGYKFEASGVKAPEGLDVPGRLASFAELVGQLDASALCDVNSVAVFAYGKRQTKFMTMLVSDSEKFKETMTEIDWTDDTGSYSCGTIGNGMSVLLDKESVWFVTASPSDAVTELEAIKKSAAKNPITALTGITDLLEGPGIVNFAVRQEAAPAKKGDKAAAQTSRWSTFSGNVANNELTGRSVNMEGDGKVIPYEGLQPVNQAVLSYVPADFNIAFALGITPDFDWSTVTSMIGTFGGFQARGMLAAVTPYLQALDGTVLLAAGPANDEAYSDVDPGNWHFILMARLPQGKINDIMGMVRSSMFMAGVTPRMEKEGLMVIPQYGMDLYLGNVDGYFAVSNLPFDPNRQNQLAPLFNGKNGALSLNIPSLQVFGSDMPSYGISVKAQVGNDNTDLKLSITGSDTPVLRAILEGLI